VKLGDLLAVLVCVSLALSDIAEARDAASLPASRPAGEAVSSPGNRTIRVRLMAGLTELQVMLPGGFDLVDPLNNALLCRVPTAGGDLPVMFDEDATAFPSLEKAFPNGVIDLVPHSHEAVTVRFGEKSKRFLGRLRFLRTEEGSGSLLNVVDIEAYLVAVVAGELDRRFHRETFRAQAIAARTYAWYQKRTVGQRRSWDVTASEGSQVYLGQDRSDEVPGASLAVHATRGLVCTWKSESGWRIFCTYYGSACGGSTQSADAIRAGSAIQPLAGDVQCEHCRSAPGFVWGPVRIAKADLTDRLRDRYERFRDIGEIERVKIVRKTSSGRPVSMAFFDEQERRIVLEAENFRLAVDPTGRVFRSTLCRLTDEGEAILLEDGRGFGHGVGMCQFGAEGLARKGLNAGGILEFYYPGSRVKRAY